MSRASLMICLLLASAWNPLHAQRAAERVEHAPAAETKKAAEKPQKKMDRAQPAPRRSTSDPSPAELQQRKVEEQRAAQRKLEERQLEEDRRQMRQRLENDARLQRAKERTGDTPPVNKPHRVSPGSEPPRGVPSPAAQAQQKPFADDGRRVRCSAHPVCRSGGYGGCRGVDLAFPGNMSVSHKDTVRQCIAVNTPDACNCAPQCSRVAQCSNF